jgi:hypothetical protein
VRDRLLQNTDRYVGLNEFNRHGILHGVFENFGQDINFLRLGNKSVTPESRESLK